VLVPGLALVFERRVRHVAGPLLNSHRCGPSAPPWAPIYRCPYSLAASQAFAVQTLCMGFNLVDPPLPALAALPESLLHVDTPPLIALNNTATIRRLSLYCYGGATIRKVCHKTRRGTINSGSDYGWEGWRAK